MLKKFRLWIAKMAAKIVRLDAHFVMYHERLEKLLTEAFNKNNAVGNRNFNLIRGRITAFVRTLTEHTNKIKQLEISIQSYREELKRLNQVNTTIKAQIKKLENER